MANNRIQVKRTSTAGRTPNTTNSGNSQYIAAGEFALNMADGILYSSNGSAVIVIGANSADQRITSSLTIDNDKSLKFKTSNTSAVVSMIQQSDDNFVMYSTNASYGQRAVWSIFANSNSSEFSFSVPVRFNVNAIVGSLSANGTLGSPGQVLVSNGSTTYWGSVSGLSSVNVAAQYTWTNTHTFQSNVSYTANALGLATNTSAIYLNGTADANWKIGRNTGATPKWYYSNNTLDIIAANSNLEGVVFGFVGNSYLETGHAGTFIKDKATVGNSSVNAVINATTYAIGTSFTANSTVVNAVSYNVGTRVVANSTVVNATHLAGISDGSYLRSDASDTYSGGVLRFTNDAGAFGNNTGEANTLQIYQATGGADAFQTFHVSTDTAVHFGLDGTTNDLFVGGWSFGANKYKIWHQNNDGTGSGLDADTLDGSHASSFQTTAGLSANVATLTANNANYLGGVAAASYVQNTDSRTLSGNLVFAGANTTINAEFRVVNSTANVFFAAANGFVGVGTPSPNFKTHIVNGDTVIETAIGASAGSYYFQTHKARGTPGALAAVVSGDISGGWYSKAYDGTAYRTVAHMSTYVDGAVSTGVVPGRFSLSTSNGNATYERMRVTSGGNVGISNTTPDATLAVTGTANVSGNVTFGSVLTVAANVVLGTTTITANGGIGSAGQVLTSGAAGNVYWTTPTTGTVTSVASGNGLTGGTITTSGTLSVVAGTGGGLVSNSTGVFVTQGTGTVVNATGVHVNSAYIGTIAANSSSYTTSIVNGLAGSMPYQSAPSVTSFVTIGSANYVMTSNGSAPQWTNPTSMTVGAANSSTYANASVTNTFTVGTASYFVANGNFGIGNTTPAEAFVVQRASSAATTITKAIAEITGTAGSLFDFEHYNSVDGNGSSQIRFKKSNGTIASPTIVGADRPTGRIGSMGYDGTAFYDATLIRMAVDGTPGTGSMPGRFEFYTTPSGSTTTLERMRITSTGNVGIGTTGPVTKLVVSDAGSAGFEFNPNSSGIAQLETYNRSTSAYTGFRLNADTIRFHTGTSATERVRIDASGNVGIGTTSPTQKLTVSVADTAQAIQLRGNTGYLRIRPYQDATSGSIIDSTNAAESSYSPMTVTASTLRLFGNNGSGATIDPNGNVGIGTTSPAYKLDVAGQSRIGVAGTPGVTVYRSTAVSGFDVGLSGGDSDTTAYVYNRAAGGLVFGTNNSEKARIDASGNVGIGNTTPAYKLHVQRASGLATYGDAYWSDGTYWMSINSRQNPGTFNSLVQSGDHTFHYSDGTLETGSLVIGPWSASSKGIRIDASGNVGIGTASPSYTLQVNGSFAATTKSFVIDHPTKPDMKLRYGSLEGPENGVYVRGRVQGTTIYLPDYWENLVDEESITVSLTAIGNTIAPSVLSWNNNKVVLSEGKIDCFYHVFAERKDVDKLVVEF